MSKNTITPTVFTFTAQTVRVITIDGEPWFIAADVCDVLGYQNTSKAISDHLDPDEKGVTTGYTLGGNQKLITINESGLYALIMRSRKPEARKFAKWVTSEVLPAIRKTGRYVSPVAPVEHVEFLNHHDMQNLGYLIFQMTSRTHYKQSWINGIWKSLRDVANVSSIKQLEVRHLPVLAEECKRILELTAQFDDAVSDAEIALVKQVVRNHDAAELTTRAILADLTQRKSKRRNHSYIDKAVSMMLNREKTTTDNYQVELMGELA